LKSREVVATPTPPTTPTQDIDPTLPPDAGSGSGASGSGSPVDDPAPLPPICNDYKAELEKLAKCRRIKVDIREAAKKRYDLIVEGWGKVRDKEKIRESTESLCRTGVELVLDLRKHLCR